MLLFTEFSEMSNHLILISISPEVKSKYPIEMGQKNMYNYIIGTNIIYGGAAMDLEKTMKNLKSRGFGVTYFATGSEAADYVAGQIHNSSVGIGGSKTVEALGLGQTLTAGNDVEWHWLKPGRETHVAALTADYYICSANAISEDGEILNIDGTGNRVAATLFGHKKVFIVAGTNKICPDFASALERARNVAAVKNASRFDISTPCKIDGKCHDCRSPQRICNALTVLWGPMKGMETEVVLIGEELGY